MSHNLCKIGTEIGTLMSYEGWLLSAPIIMRRTRKSAVGLGKRNNLWKNEIAESVDQTVEVERAAPNRCTMNIQISETGAGTQMTEAATNTENSCKRSADLAASEARM